VDKTSLALIILYVAILGAVILANLVALIWSTILNLKTEVVRNRVAPVRPRQKGL